MSTISLPTLNKLNIYASLAHLLQAVAVFMLARDFTLPINISLLRFNQSTQGLDPGVQEVYRLPLASLIVGFFLLSAFFHAIISTLYRRRYEQDLSQGINRLRWIEYALSASTMMVAIAMLVGVYDLASLLMIFALTAGMNLMGLVMEVTNKKSKNPSWLSYLIGCGAGIVPWIVIALYFWASSHYANSAPPTFVYYIYGSIFIFFNGFAINMWLQYKRLGKWSNYLYGERTYIILSLVAKSALAWQVFAGTLRPN